MLDQGLPYTIGIMVCFQDQNQCSSYYLEGIHYFRILKSSTVLASENISFTDTVLPIMGRGFSLGIGAFGVL